MGYYVLQCFISIYVTFPLYHLSLTQSLLWGWDFLFCRVITHFGRTFHAIYDVCTERNLLECPWEILYADCDYIPYSKYLFLQVYFCVSNDFNIPEVGAETSLPFAGGGCCDAWAWVGSPSVPLCRNVSGLWSPYP